MGRIVGQAIGGLLVACALAVPAVAAQHPNDRAGAQGVGGVAMAATGTSAATHSLRPDGRELPDSVDLASVPTVVVKGDSFDWSDAGIGVAGGFGLALVLVGILATTQHARGVSRA